MMLDQLLTGRNLSLAGGVFVLMSLIKNFVAPQFWLSKVGQRVLPVLPIVFGLGLAFIGVCDCAIWQDKLVIGLIAGWASSNLFKIGKTSVLGYNLDDVDGDGIPDAQAARTQPVAPAVVSPVVTDSVAPAAAVDAPVVAATEKKE